jgi:hypothetical protein
MPVEMGGVGRHGIVPDGDIAGKIGCEDEVDREKSAKYSVETWPHSAVRQVTMASFTTSLTHGRNCKG